MITYESFLNVFLFEFEKYLNSIKDELKKISFQLDEANTDRPLKEFIKNHIENNFKAIPSDSKIYFLKKESEILEITNEFENTFIQKVLLPENITEEIKQKLNKDKKSIFKNPDLCFEINMNGEIFYETIELKSTKKDSIPGSSVQQINPSEYVIFIKHDEKNNEIDITTGQYIHTINTKMQFPDRSPRPQVSFLELKNWNEKNRIFEDNTLIFIEDSNDIAKQNLLSDWQKVLSDRWLNILFEENSVKQNEPWFNNTIRKFSISLLEKYDSLSDTEKESLKTRIKSLIQSC